VLIELNRKIKAKPEVIAQQHKAYGIPDNERAAIDLLPGRMADLYAVDWNQAVFANLDRQVAESVKAGILPAVPKKPVYLPALSGAGQ
jgi:NitT/TauT family transport system substrate-binding protein